MEAGKGKTIIKVGERVNTMGDGSIIVSERLEILALTGTVLSTDGDMVSVGDTIHVPHNEVSEYTHGGKDFAIVPTKRLFAKRVAGEWVPINRNALVNKCENEDIMWDDGNVLLHMIDAFKEDTHWVEIVAIADDCKILTKDDIGGFCLAPENSDRLARIERTKVFCLGEEIIGWVTQG